MTRQRTLRKHARPREQELRRLLEEQRDRILEMTRSRMRDVRGEGNLEAGAVLDDAEVSEAEVQTDLELALLQMQRETLVKIEAALDALKAGTYGRCVWCGEEISTARLRALPFAIRCKHCEETHEMERPASPPLHLHWSRPERTLDIAA